jgi:hypothetical protein
VAGIKGIKGTPIKGTPYLIYSGFQVALVIPMSCKALLYTPKHSLGYSENN